MIVLKILVKEFKMLELQLHVLFQLAYVSQIFMDQLFYFLIGLLKIYTWANVSRRPCCSFKALKIHNSVWVLTVIWSGYGNYTVKLILSYQHTHYMDNSTCACSLIIHKLALCALRKVVPTFVQNPELFFL